MIVEKESIEKLMSQPKLWFCEAFVLQLHSLKKITPELNLKKSPELQHADFV